MNWIHIGILLLIFCPPALAQRKRPPDNRIASVMISQEFINEQLAAHSKSDLIKDLTIQLDPKLGKIMLVGKLQVPVEELRAINLDPKLGAFKFKLTLKPDTTPEGHLILEFPLAETYFYPANVIEPYPGVVVVSVQCIDVYFIQYFF